MDDFEKLLDKKNLFYKGLENLSEFRSIMAFSKDPEMQELQQSFDQGFTQLRDVFQKAMDNKAASFHTGSVHSRLKKKALYSKDNVSLDEAKQDSLRAINKMKLRVNEWAIRDALSKMTAQSFWRGKRSDSLDEAGALEVIKQLKNRLSELNNEDDVLNVYDTVSHYL